MDNGPDLRSMLAELEAEHQRLRTILAGKDIASLGQRPPSGKWSIVENVQHLVFAEREHLARIALSGQDWTEYGLAEVRPRNLKQLRLSTDRDSVDALLDAWRAAHGELVAHLMTQDSPDFRHRLGRHITHQRTHIKEIERLLRGGR